MFDEEPEGDPHAECAHHIHQLEVKIAELKSLLVLLAKAIHDEDWKQIGALVPLMTSAINPTE